MEFKPGIVNRLRQALTRPGSLAGESVNIFFADSVVMLLSTVTGILTARLFGPEGKGVITMVSLIPMTMFYLGCFGMPDTMAYFLSRFPERVAENFYTILALTCLAGIITVAAAYASIDWWHPYYQAYSRQYFVIVLPLGMLLTLTVTLRYGFLGLGNIWNFNLINVLQALGLLLVVLVAGLLLHQSLEAYFWLTLLNGLLMVMLVLFLIFKRRPELKTRPRNYNFSRILNYAARIYPTSIIFLFQIRLDHFLIGYFLPPKELGIYSIAIFLSENLLRITAAFQMALFPRVSADATDRKYALVAKVLRITNLVNIVLTLLIAAAGYPLILLLFGKPFAPAYLPLLVLLIGRVPEGLYKITSSTFAAIGRPGLSSLLGVVGIVINGILGLVLIPQMGLLGAGLAKTLSLCAQFVPAFIIFQRESRLGFAQTLAVRREDWMDIRDRVRNFLSSL